MTSDADDPYWKLRPLQPTPNAELCHCQPVGVVVLVDRLAENPLYCFECNGEVPPERLGIDAGLAEEIANWRSVYDSLYRLWLDSGEYEAWAAERLSDPEGQVNRSGREIVARLNRVVPAFYLWFNNSEVEEVPPSVCPVCSASLRSFEHKFVRECARCRILV